MPIFLVIHFAVAGISSEAPSRDSRLRPRQTASLAHDGAGVGR
jgi:hypothetical protein